MSLHRINFAQVAAVPLTEDDRLVLNASYKSRLRAFWGIFSVLLLLITFRSSLYILENDDVVQVAAAFTAVMLVVVLPGAVTFWKCVWAYRRDGIAGYKYVVHELVIRKTYFRHTGQYFIALDDAQYMHHEVEQSTYESIGVGDRYPVYFAAHSRYPFTLRERVTMM